MISAPFITRFFLLLLVVVVINLTHAQEQIHFKHLTIDNGLNSNHLQAITQDTDGYMWFGTATGLRKYDGKRFQVYHYDILQKDGLPGNSIEEFFHGPKYSLWIKTSGGFCIYNKSTDSFISNIDSVLRSFGLPEKNLDQVWTLGDSLFGFLYSDGNVYLFNSDTSLIRGLAHGDVKSVAVNRMNRELYTVNKRGEIEIFNLTDLQSIRKISSPVPSLSESNINYRIFLDEDSNLWLYAKNFPLGAYRYDRSRKRRDHFSRNSNKYRLNSDNVNCIQYLDRKVWLGTDHGGINIIDGDKITYSVHQQFETGSLPFNATSTLYSDGQGTIWVGTYKGGVSYYSKQQTFVKTIRSNPGDSSSLPFDDVNCFVEDPRGNIWIGTNGGGLIKYNPTTGRYKSFQYRQRDPNSLSSNVVVSLYIDQNKTLWIGTFNGGLNEMNFEGIF